jgi:hypothetical protein
MATSSLEIILVPDEALVECPDAEKKLRPVHKCDGCRFYRGLVDRFPQSAYPFRARYLVACGYPTTRQIFELEADAATK